MVSLYFLAGAILLFAIRCRPGYGDKEDATRRIPELLAIFDQAIIDLEMDSRSQLLMPNATADNLRYVVAAIELHSFSLRGILQQKNTWVKAHRADVDTAINDSASFAEELVKEGFGLPVISNA